MYLPQITNLKFLSLGCKIIKSGRTLCNFFLNLVAVFLEPSNSNQGKRNYKYGIEVLKRVCRRAYAERKWNCIGLQQVIQV